MKNLVFFLFIFLLQCNTTTLLAQTEPDDIALANDEFQNYFYESLVQKGIENYDKAIIINEVKTLERKISPITYSTFALNVGIQGAFKNHFLINFFFGAGYASVFPKNGNDITTSIFQGNTIPFDSNGNPDEFKNITFKMGLYLGGVWEKERKK